MSSSAIHPAVGGPARPITATTSFADNEALSRAVSADPAAIGFIGGEGQLPLVGFAGQKNASEKLSRLRVESLAKLLEQRGIARTRVDGFGSALPLAPNTTPEGRERNRRVEAWVR
jgi:hypothetical protein